MTDRDLCQRNFSQCNVIFKNNVVVPCDRGANNNDCPECLVIKGNEAECWKKESGQCKQREGEALIDCTNFPFIRPAPTAPPTTRPPTTRPPTTRPPTTRPPEPVPPPNPPPTPSFPPPTPSLGDPAGLSSPTPSLSTQMPTPSPQPILSSPTESPTPESSTNLGLVLLFIGLAILVIFGLAWKVRKYYRTQEGEQNCKSPREYPSSCVSNGRKVRGTRRQRPNRGEYGSSSESDSSESESDQESIVSYQAHELPSLRFTMKESSIDSLSPAVGPMVNSPTSPITSSKKSKKSKTKRKKSKKDKASKKSKKSRAKKAKAKQRLETYDEELEIDEDDLERGSYQQALMPSLKFTVVDGTIGHGGEYDVPSTINTPTSLKDYTSAFNSPKDTPLSPQSSYPDLATPPESPTRQDALRLSMDGDELKTPDDGEVYEICTPAGGPDLAFSSENSPSILEDSHTILEDSVYQ